MATPLSFQDQRPVTLLGQTQNGKFLQMAITPEGHLEVAIRGPVTAFDDEVSVAQPTPVIQQNFVYVNNTDLLAATTQGSGAVTNSNGMAVVTAAAGAASLASLRTKHSIVYRNGQGCKGRFSVLWNTAARADPSGASTTAGFGTSESGLFFGYVGGSGFSIVHNETNTREQQSATITTKSSNVQNATVTLAGVAYTVPVTNGADTTVTAYEIAKFDYNSTWPGWTSFSLGSIVYFIATQSGNQVGAFSITFPTSGVSSAFTELVAGALGTTTIIPQTTWNYDRMDGTGSVYNPSSMLLDTSKLNVFQITWQYLGAGKISFFIEDSASGELTLVHQIKRANSAVLPSLKNPGFPFQLSARNVTGVTAVGMSCCSIGAFVEGQITRTGVQNSYIRSVTGITTTLTPIFTIRATRIFNGKVSTAEIVPIVFRCANTGSKGLELYAFEGSTLTTPNFSSLNASTSIAEVSTAAGTISGGIQRFAAPVGAGSRETIDMSDIDGLVEAGSWITVAAKSVTTTTDATVSFQWWEDQ